MNKAATLVMVIWLLTALLSYSLKEYRMERR